MPLTEEQRERIRKNRERALQLQKERNQQKEKEESDRKRKQNNTEKESEASKQSPSNKKTKKDEENDETNTTDGPIEQFEEGASEWVTKKEAMNVYCLPEGTLAVCEVEERENPHNKLWKPMKLYRRSEIRERAHKRYGGVDGLIAERTKRRERKFAKDMEAAKNIFKWTWRWRYLGGCCVWNDEVLDVHTTGRRDDWILTGCFVEL